MIESRSTKKLNSIFLALLAMAVTARLILIYIRWINPDEGAHLMAARLFIMGYMPIVDYGARQPIYLFSLVGLIKAFGNSYLFGRLLPLLASVGTGVVLYALAKRLYDQKTGLVAAALFWFAPLPFIWSAVVKTEPLAIFFVCLSVYLFSYSFGDRFLRSGAMLLAGIFAAMAYFSRQTTLYLPLAIVIFQFLRQDINKSGALRQLFLFILGYTGLCVSIGAFFLKQLPLNKMVFTQLNPFNLVYNRLAHLFGWLPDEFRVVDTEGFRILNQSIDYTLQSWRDASFFSLFIIIAAIFTIAGWIRRKNQFQIQQNKGIFFFLIWLFCVIAFYIFQSVNRGFYTQYLVEAYPPLVLLAARYMRNGFYVFKKQQLHMALSLAGLFVALFTVQRLAWFFYPGMLLYILFSITVAALFLYGFMKKNKRLYILTTIILLLLSALVYYLLAILAIDLIAIVAMIFFCNYVCLRFLLQRRIQMAGVYAANFIVIAGVFVSALYCGHLIGPRYESVWSPATVDKTVAVLQKHGTAVDDILSGGMIWTFESGFLAWQRVAHPTEFLKKKDKDFQADFSQKPPTFIIFDGYTGRKFARYMEFLNDEIERHYEKIALVYGSRDHLEIYKRKHDFGSLHQTSADDQKPNE